MISILIITYGREEELFQTLKAVGKYSGDDKVELLLLDNNPEDRLKNQIENIFESSKIDLRYFHDGKNYGVALGRNYVMKRAHGDIFIVLDDDIEIESIDFIIKRVKEYFKDLTVGAIAFNIKNWYIKESLRFEIPHGNKKLDFSKNLYTYYFIGAGHALRKEVLDKVGYYPEDLGKYGGEERDLSFRIIKHWKILYAADIVIYHKISQNGRMPKKEENFFRYRNQVLVLGRYLPFIYRWSSFIAWSGWYILKKKGKLKEIWKVFKELVRVKKSVIDRKTLEYIKKTGGRLFY